MKKKIEALFDYRKLPVLLKQGNYTKNSSLYTALIDLQIAIYELDSFLESNWKIAEKPLRKYWKSIKQALENTGVASSKTKDYLAHIRRYQKHELQLRKGKMPTDYSLEYYYYYKSCDVKLIRRIIYDYIPDLKNQYSLADWRIFDLITEIDDDVEDIYEDTQTINGNYVLLALLQNDNIESKLVSYLSELELRAKQRFLARKTKDADQLLKWTNRENKMTKTLLKKQMHSLNSPKLNRSKILKHISI